MRWSHVGLNCTDQKVTEEFYTRWFGFTRARVVDLGASQIVFLRKGDAYLELFPAGTEPARAAQEDGPQAPGRMRHLAFQTDSVDAFLADLGDAAEVTLGPLDFDDFICGWRTVWLRDPDGVIVEVSQGYHDDEAGPSRTTAEPTHDKEGARHG
ncbi:VOC family protein [Streptomyces sp. NRRL S-87]|uniref:VOC family protein n=1 Tax=Streptomyces sp. NRRL S-87 TaxID=1463920 RepID=UPI0004C2651A|nr:VOC family protein [Streptomyces sp. NRRL S-87]